MAANPRIRRITLVPYEGPDDELRRYRLARMDEIALATPPNPAASRQERDAPSRMRAAKPPGGRARRA